MFQIVLYEDQVKKMVRRSVVCVCVCVCLESIKLVFAATERAPKWHSCGIRKLGVAIINVLLWKFEYYSYFLAH